MILTVPNTVLAYRDLVLSLMVGEGMRVETVLGIIWQESAGNPWAVRYEPRYEWFYDPTGKKPLRDRRKTLEENRYAARLFLGETEFNCQSFSWGILQIMGAAARERGFRGDMTKLCVPETGLKFGIKHLWEFAYAGGKYSTVDALTRWNGSRAYAKAVVQKISVIE